MVAFIKSASKYLNSLGKVLTQIFVAIMAVTVTIQVIWRYFLNSPIIWAEELARYSLVWMTFIGAAVAQHAGQLANIDLVVNKLPVRFRSWIRLSVLIVSILLLAFLFYYSVLLVRLPSVVNQKSPALGIPMTLPYLALPVGLGLMLLQGVFQLITMITETKGES